VTSREAVIRTIRFQGADRIPGELPEPFGNDFVGTGMNPSLDDRPSSGVDQWGSVWENVGVCKLGEVKDFALKEWSDWDKLVIPDMRDEKRWGDLPLGRPRAGDKFLLAWGVSLYERVHFIRGLENTWVDTIAEPEALGKLIDLLVDMNLYAIERFAKAGADGYMWCDDWGLQKGLMIAPDAWRKIWKPRYARVYKAAHDAELLTFLHSCGDITSILDDLIEAGLDVIQMDQQENMGLENLGQRFGGRITFWCPVDIQNTMVRGSTDDIRKYCGKLVQTLGRSNGGFMARWYSDPKGAGHGKAAIEAMCAAFRTLSRERAELWKSSQG